MNANLCLMPCRVSFPQFDAARGTGGNRTLTSGAKCLQPSRKDSSLRRSEMFIDRNSRKDSSLRRSEMFIDRDFRKDSSLRRSEMFIDRNSRKDSSLRRSDMFIAPKLSKRLFAPEERYVYRP